MAVVEKKVNKQAFIGRAWKNVAGPNTENAGTVFLSLRIDSGVKVTLTEKDSILLWPQTKREGKQDADFRMSVEIKEITEELVDQMATAPAGIAI